jgi:hypothetical protein
VCLCVCVRVCACKCVRLCARVGVRVCVSGHRLTFAPSAVLGGLGSSQTIGTALGVFRGMALGPNAAGPCHRRGARAGNNGVLKEYSQGGTHAGTHTGTHGVLTGY